MMSVNNRFNQHYSTTYSEKLTNIVDVVLA